MSDAFGELSMEWTEEALATLERVPAGHMREMTRRRVELLARTRGETLVTLACVKAKYEGWGEGSPEQKVRMKWAPEVVERVSRIPAFIRGMVIKEVETVAQAEGRTEVSGEFYEKQRSRWMEQMKFHHEF